MAAIKQKVHTWHTYMPAAKEVEAWQMEAKALYEHLVLALAGLVVPSYSGPEIPFGVISGPEEEGENFASCRISWNSVPHGTWNIWSKTLRFQTYTLGGNLVFESDLYDGTDGYRCFLADSKDQITTYCKAFILGLPLPSDLPKSYEGTQFD